MQTEQAQYQPSPATGRDKAEVARKLDALGWGLFFVWLGTAWLADVGLGIGLVGIGLITLGMQAARRGFAVRIERFWVAVGLMFLLGGVWNLVEVGVMMAPIVSIAAGVLLIVSLLLPKARSDRATHP